MFDNVIFTWIYEENNEVNKVLACSMAEGGEECEAGVGRDPWKGHPIPVKPHPALPLFATPGWKTGYKHSCALLQLNSVASQWLPYKGLKPLQIFHKIICFEAGYYQGIILGSAINGVFASSTEYTS